jgi:predicted regulator of Ras-like GTPase activity (Roadblock/LC7/MglB family)
MNIVASLRSSVYLAPIRIAVTRSRVSALTRAISTQVNMAQSYKVVKVSELKDGQMKEVAIPGTQDKILLSRIQGSFYATGSRCTRILLYQENR